METTERAAVHVEHPRCPYCHDEVKGGEEKIACLECMAWHHRTCWNEQARRCAACGRAATTEGYERVESTPRSPVSFARRSATSAWRFGGGTTALAIAIVAAVTVLFVIYVNTFIWTAP